MIREVALDALSQLFLIDLLGLPAPELTVEDDALVIKSSAIDYEYDIPFPRSLCEQMGCNYSERLAALKCEYGIPGSDTKTCEPRGDRIGAMLRYYKALDRLIRIVSVVKCWNQPRVLTVHGLPDNRLAQELQSDLETAGFHYLIVYPESDTRGSGMLRSVSMPEAIAMVNELWTRKAGAVERFLDLRENYGRHQWLSDDNTWACEESIGKSDNLRTH